MRREGSLSNLGPAIEKYLQGRGLIRAGRESLVPIVWPEVVGDWYRRHTEITRVENGVVSVACDSAARAQQLQLDSAQIVRALNARVGGHTVKEVRPSSGGIRPLERARAPEEAPPEPLPTSAELERIELEPPEWQWIASALAPVSDERLRRRLEQVLSKDRKLQRWRASHGYALCQSCGGATSPGRRLCRACEAGAAPGAAGVDGDGSEWDARGEGRGRRRRLVAR